MQRISPLIFTILILIANTAKASADNKKELWVYTSLYKEFAAPIEKAFEEKYPDVDVHIFQAGSEKIQAKIEAELLANRPQADVLITSDPFWTTALDKRGLVLSRPTRPNVDINYYSLMVIISHKDFPLEKRPAAFSDLAKPEYKNLTQFGSPLESGTAFAAVAYLSRKYGWDFFKKLSDNKLASNGGNSTVIQKVESAEKKLGVVLLENALAAKKRGSPIEIIYPSDGSIPIPSVQAILKTSKQPEAASRFAEFLLSTDGQKLLRNGYMHSVRKDVQPPEGAPALTDATKNSTKWSADLFGLVADEAKTIKEKYATMLLD
ncbi:MAG: extracellular solute-binding protein [Bdellovibrionota bacterium]